MTFRHLLFLILILFLPAPPLQAEPKPRSADAGHTLEDIHKLIRQLGSPVWREREEAQKSLERIGDQAIAALQKAQNSTDREVVFRSREILNSIDPLENAVALCEVLVPSEAPARWSIQKTHFFQGITGRIPLSNNSLVLVSLTQAVDQHPRASISVSYRGLLSPIQISSPDGASQSFFIAEKRIELNTIQSGIQFHAFPQRKLVLLWSAADRKSRLKKITLPLRKSDRSEEMRAGLRALLLKQLAEGTERSSRLHAGEILSLLGEKEALPHLEKLAGLPRADCALARLGRHAAHGRILKAIEDGPPPPGESSMLITLAKLGNTTAFSLLGKRLESLSGYEFKEAVLSALERIREKPDALSFAQQNAFLSEALSTIRSSNRTTIQLLLAALCRNKTSAHTLLLPALKKELANPGDSGRTALWMFVLNNILARFPPPREELVEIVDLLASSMLDTTWRDIVTCFPYLYKCEGPAIFKPFFTLLPAVMTETKYTYRLKYILTALALIIPPESESGKTMVSLLKPYLVYPADATTRIVLQPLGLLLRAPNEGTGAAAVNNLKSRCDHLLSTGSVLPQKRQEYEVYLWNAEKRGEKVTIHEHRYFRIPSEEPVSYTTEAGCLRFLAIEPQTSASSTYLRLLAPGKSNYFQSGQPKLVSLYPDKTARTISFSDVLLTERYQTSEDFEQEVILVEPVPPSGPHGDLSWDEMLTRTAKGLSRQMNKTELNFFARLGARAVLPELQKRFRTDKTPDLAATLARLGDPAGKAYLLKELAAASGRAQLSALRLLLEIDPGNRQAAEVLIAQLRQHNSTTSIYNLITCVRTILNNSPPEPVKRTILRALVDILSIRNINYIVPLLRNETSRDFGFYQTLSTESKLEQQQRQQKVIELWKEAFSRPPTDK